MKLIILEISANLRNLLKPDSIINNYSDVKTFYFSIPTKLSNFDQNHLVKQSFLFFKSQFSGDVENHISIVNKSDIGINLKVAKELSWEIFFRFNRWVRVCDGIFDEDLDWFISGFTGKILDFYSDDENSVFLIAFSGESISKIPFDHLQKNINNISPFYTFLESEFIMPDEGPENTNADEKLRIEIMLQLTNFQINSSLEKFDRFSDLLQFWEDQFKDKLVNPIEVRINSADQSIYQLVDIPYYDERFGVWVTLFSDEKIVDIPIMEIVKVINNKIFNELIIKYKKMMAIVLPN
ncbi:MAG: hypothetical protein K0B14_05705 [Anaerolineaceae bacterium]|nr:hypothetical protein [Anaerolineaceae bacterium]